MLSVHARTLISCCLLVAPWCWAWAGPSEVDPSRPQEASVEGVELERAIEMALEALERGAYTAAWESASMATERVDQGETVDPALLLDSLELQARIARERQRYDQAVSLLEELGVLLDEHGREERAEEVQQDQWECSLYARVMEHFLASEKEEAIALLVTLEQAMERRHGSEHPELAQLHNDMGFFLLELRFPEKAHEQIQQSLEWRLASLPTGHPKLVESWMNMASALGALGRYDESRRAYDQAVTSWRSSPPGVSEPPSYEQVLAQRRVPGSAPGQRELERLAGGEKPWSELGLTGGEYQRWWSDGQDLRRVSLARGRRGQLLFRGIAGFVGGPYYSIYHMYYEPGAEGDLELDAVTLDVYSEYVRPQAGISIGFGLTSLLELYAAAEIRSGESRLSDNSSDGYLPSRLTPMVEIDVGLRSGLRPMGRVSPLLGVGMSAIHGQGASSSWPEGGSALGSFRGFTSYHLQLLTGLEFRPRWRGPEIVVELPVRRMVSLAWDGPDAGELDVRFRRRAHHGRDNSLGLQLGLQWRLGFID